ncbi:LamG-like jellyroll fold domain-containing protein [Roseibacillus persicicus]|uniref:LamG-like jellyroll fold domain-containing protein n=1 Tax=Roseibacillus persicicus TaxID=454148 RepID=UPI00398A7ACA
MNTTIARAASAALTISYLYAEPSQPQISEGCDCCFHPSVTKSVTTPAPAAEEHLLTLPDGLPESFTLQVPFEGEMLTLRLEKNEIFGENTRFLVAGAGGQITEIDPGPERSYLGTVAEHSDFAVNAVLFEEGLIANIIRPSEEPIVVKPVENAPARSLHSVQLESGSDRTASAPQAATLSTTGSSPVQDGPEEAQSLGPIMNSVFVMSLGSSALPSSTATLPPSRVMEIYEYEIGVEIGSRAFLSDTYNSNLATAQASAQSVIGNLDARYLRSAGIKHRLGTVMIRTDAATDPLRDSVTATGGAANASSSLSAFRNYWNSNAAEVGSTHDLAVYHVRSNPSGLAYVNSVGTSSRYATCGGNGATSWADGTLAHEFGHSWSLGHYDSNKGTYYESKPRSNSGSNSAGGSDVFVCVMHGGGDHNIGRLSTGEANQVYNVRQGKRNHGTLVTNPGPIPPFGHRDEATASGSPINIDVVANDYDGNNDILDVRLLDTVSQKGASISLSAGTGPGGRNEITYTPPANFSGNDFFHYTVCDTTGRTDWGAVYVSNIPPATVDLSRTKYFYDVGTFDSPLFTNSADPYERISDVSSGDFGFTSAGPNPVESRDRGNISGVNEMNRDHIRMRSPGTFHHKLAHGIYNLLFTIGDATENSNSIRLTAESAPSLTTGNHTPATFTNYTINNVRVEDGELNVDIENLGFSSNITRIVITRVGDVDDDDLLDLWELQHFGDITTTSGLASEDADDDLLTDLEEHNAGTDPNNPDTDGDTLSDADEVLFYLTDPTLADSDSDGFSDATELAYRVSPLDPASKPSIPNLVAYYPFDEATGTTAKNFGSAGGAADGEQNQGTIGWTTTGQMIGSSSLDLDGSSSLVAGSAIPSSATEFTISLWVNPDTDGGFKGIFVGRENPGNWGINIENSHADVRYANSAGTSLGVDTPNTYPIEATGGWYHVAQTWSSTGSSTTGKVYLNGNLVGTTTSARTDFTQPTLGFLIGDDNCCGGREFNGQIDDLAVFTRALTDDEIANAFTAGQTGGTIIASLAPVFPSPLPSDLTIDPQTGNVHFSFDTDPFGTYRIYRSPNLTNWTLLDTVLGDGTPYPYIHVDGFTDDPVQFYRVE